MQKDIVVDLETLGATPDAVVLQVAALTFEQAKGGAIFDDFGDPFNMYVDPGLQAGRKINGGTVAWWLAQSAEARGMIAAGIHEAGSLGTVLARFVAWVALQRPFERVWCRGQDFDLGILRHALDESGLQLPWRYDAGRDTRTLYEATFSEGRTTMGSGIAHDALSDCITEARMIQDAFALRRSGL